MLRLRRYLSATLPMRLSRACSQCAFAQARRLASSASSCASASFLRSRASWLSSATRWGGILPIPRKPRANSIASRNSPPRIYRMSCMTSPFSPVASSRQLPGTPRIAIQKLPRWLSFRVGLRAIQYLPHNLPSGASSRASSSALSCRSAFTWWRSLGRSAIYAALAIWPRTRRSRSRSSSPAFSPISVRRRLPASSKNSPARNAMAAPDRGGAMWRDTVEHARGNVCDMFHLADCLEFD